MANQHTLTIPLSQATERQLLVHIASRMETHMADMTAALDRLAASLAKDVADIRDDLLTKIDGLTAESQAAKAVADIRDDFLTQIDGLTAESQAAKDALAAKVAELDNAVARVESFSDELDANDAPAPTDPETPADPEQPEQPEEPVDPEPQPEPEQPVDPDAPVQ